MIRKFLCFKRFSSRTKTLIDQESKYNGCNFYQPLPIVIEKAKGPYAWDLDGKRYIDFLAGYGSVNHGHCHPEIYKAIEKQTQRITVVSRWFMDDQVGPYEKMISDTFGFEKVQLKSGGVEGTEGAVKFSRRWGVYVKGIDNEKVTILFASNHSWGHSIAACASSEDPKKNSRFGPFKNLGFEIVKYDCPIALETKLKENPNVAAFLVEPIQTSAGCILPETGYLKKCRELCDKYNVLLIFDEVSTGLGRTGKMLASDYEGVKPDILVLGKSLSGGYFPLSACLAGSEVMDQIRVNNHGSSYSANTLACAIGQASLKILKEEGMIENSAILGTKFKNLLKTLDFPFIKEVRGKGLMVAIEFDKDWEHCAQDVVLELVKSGVLVRQAIDSNIILFTPTLVISKNDIHQVFEKLQTILNDLR